MSDREDISNTHSSSSDTTSDDETETATESLALSSVVDSSDSDSDSSSSSVKIVDRQNNRDSIELQKSNPKPKESKLQKPPQIQNLHIPKKNIQSPQIDSPDTEDDNSIRELPLSPISTSSPTHFTSKGSGKTVRFTSSLTFSPAKSPVNEHDKSIDILLTGATYSYEEQLPAEDEWSSFPNDLIEVQKSTASVDTVDDILKNEMNYIKSAERVQNESLSADSAPQFVKSICEQFRNHYVTVKNKYKKFSKVKMNEDNFKNHRFEIDTEEQKTAEGDVKFNTALLDPTFESAKQYIQDNMTSKTMKIYDMVTNSMESSWAGNVEKTICNRDKLVRQDLLENNPILLEFIKFETQFDILNVEKNETQIEPLFLSMFLVDTHEKKRISEVFHIDLNDKQVMGSLVHAALSDSVNDIKNALFYVNNRSPNVHLIILISKVLEGDEETVISRYVKPKPKSIQAKKLKTKVNTLCSRLGSFRQYVGWTFVPLFDNVKEDSRKTYPLSFNGKYSIKQFFRCRGSMTIESIINTIENPGTLKKLKFIPAQLDLVASELEIEIKCKDNLSNIVQVSIDKEDGSQESESDDSSSSSKSSSSDGSEESRVVQARNIFEFRTNPDYNYTTEYMHNIYVRPLSVNLSSKELKRKSSQNIAVMIELKSSDDKIDAHSLLAIYGKSSEPLLLSSSYATVTYHERAPEFCDEFKVRLPSILSPKHNFVFTFYHVSIRGGMTKKQNTLIGRSFVPVLEACGTLISGKKSLPIAVDIPKDMKEYLNRSDLKYLSNGKLLFNVEFEDASTIYTHDSSLHSFYSIFPNLYNSENSTPNSPSEITDTIEINDTSKVNTEEDELILNGLEELLNTSDKALHKIVHSLPTIFDHLLRIMCFKEIYPKSSMKAFNVFILLCSKITNQMRQKNRNTLITTYIQNLFKNFEDVPKKVKIFEILPGLWTQLMHRLSNLQHARLPHKEEKSLVTKSFEFSWVVFDLINKSLTLHLESENILSNPEKPRWKSPEFSADILNLISTLTTQLSTLYEKHLDSKSLNNSLGLFMRDMLDISDRGSVLTWADYYLSGLAHYPTTHPFNYLASEMRVQFMEILADYEQFIPMSLPKLFSVEATSDVESLFTEYFLGGLLLKHISKDLMLTQRNGRQLATMLLRNILSKHEYDIRYQNPEVRSKIITMYFPLVLTFLDKFDRFITLNESKVHGLKNTIDVLQTQIDKIETQLGEYRQKLDVGEKNNKKLIEQDIQTNEEKLKRLNNNIKEVQQEYDDEKLRCRDEKQSVFVCIMFILINMDRHLLKDWFSHSSKARLKSFFSFLKLCLETFEYRGKEIIASSDFNHDSLKSVSQTKSFFEQRYNNLSNPTGSLTLGSKSQTGTLRNFRAHIGAGATMRRNRPNITSVQVKGLSKWEGCLSSEITLNIMMIVSEFVEQFQESSNQSSERKEDIIRLYKKNIFPSIFNIILHALNRHEYQSRIALRSVIYQIRIIIGSFQTFLFEPDTPYTEELCLTILKCCTSIHRTIRSHSTALLYSLLKCNYLESGRFTKTKMNTTVSLSNLVESMNETSVSLLQKCFETIALYAQKDPSTPPESKERRSIVKTIQEEQIRDNSQKIMLIGMTKFIEDADFASQVVELTKRLNSTLLFTVQVNKEREDDKISSESVAETMLRISHNYRHAPELSISWLNNLYKFHNKCQRDAEAAMVTILMAATSYQYLKLKKVKSVQTLRYAYLEESSPTLKENEFAELKHLFEDPIEPEFSHTFFTESGFVQLIHRAIASLKKAKHYEYCIYLFKLLVQYYEPQRSYKELNSIYQQMSEYYDLIEKNTDQNRLFGTYYKIGLYGIRAGDKNGFEYLYKFPKITRLGEVTDYLEKYFFPLYGKENVKVKSESFKIDDSIKNNPDFVYIQVACVNPIFDLEDVRFDYFEKNTNMKQFVYEAPFTLSGKAHGPVTDQCIRRTILTSRHAFPGLLAQSDILKKEIIELSPIEYAIQTVDKSLQKLQDESSKDPPEMNSLHLVLMGTVIPTVNEGVPAIVKAFLGNPEDASKWPEVHINQLKQSLKSFLNLNSEAIIVSSQHKTKKQAPLHLQFVSGYRDLYNLITGCIGSEDILSPEDLEKQAP